MVLRAATFLCGASAAFGIDLLGELFWAELLLPLLAAAVLAGRWPHGLFANGAFRILMLSMLAMLVGYVVSDLAARTPPDLYLKGWARVVALGSSALALCVVCHRDARCLWWFCLGMGAGGIAQGLLAGEPLAQWKLGYGEDVAYLVAGSGALVPLWLSSILLLGLGWFSILLDYRSLGAQLMLVAVAVLVARRKPGARRMWRTALFGMAGAALVGAATVSLLNSSQEENEMRRTISNSSRFAALSIGTQAVLDSPLIGYGSWGQGTEKYAAMLYDETVDDAISAGADGMLRRGSRFSAHSQLIQAWMEGGILAAGFFVIYIALLVRAGYRCLFRRPADYLTPVVLHVIAINLWASLMSPFLGSQRISIAVAMATIVVLLGKREGRPAGTPQPVRLRRPSNLMP